MTMKSHGHITIEVYENGELVHSDTDNTGWAQVQLLGGRNALVLQGVTPSRTRMGSDEATGTAERKNMQATEKKGTGFEPMFGRDIRIGDKVLDMRGKDAPGGEELVIAARELKPDPDGKDFNELTLAKDGNTRLKYVSHRKKFPVKRGATRGELAPYVSQRSTPRFTLPKLGADIVPILAGFASRRMLVTYEELVQVLRRMDPERYGSLMNYSYALGPALGDASKTTLRRHGFAISAIVVSEVTGVPGKGFATLCGAAHPLLDYADEQRKTFAHFVN